jgi:hypothetical protein
VTTPVNGNTRHVPRWPIAVLLVVLAIAAVIVGNGESRATTPARRVGGDVAAMPAPTARSSAWYCPGPPPSPSLARAREGVRVANLEPRAVDVAVTLLRDKHAPSRRMLRVPARSSLAAVSSTEAARGAAVVEPFAAHVVVDATNNGTNALTETSCATQPSSRWYFAAGTTVRGVEQWLVLFNPFGDDAVVDLSFYTDSGLQEPGDLQALTVPRRSRVAIEIDQKVRRQQSVATAVVTRAGRIVAQQTLVFGTGSGRTGETRSLGAVKPASEWVFPSGRTMPGAVRTLAISNPGALDAEADVTIAPAADIAIEPVTVHIPRTGVANVQIGACGALQPPACIQVPPNVGYSADVRATLDVPVVVEDLATFTAGRYTGAVAGPGSRQPAREWVFARSRVTGELDAGLDLITTGGKVARADIVFVDGGKELRPADLQDIVLRPGVRRSVPLASRRDLRGLDAAIVVRADRPFVAERTIVRRDDLTRTIGVPSRD